MVCLAPARFGPWGFLFGVASRRLLAWDCSWNRRAVRTLGYVPSRAQLRRNRHPDTGEASVIRRVSWFCHFHQGRPAPHLRIPNGRSGRSARRKGDPRTVPEYTWASQAALYKTNSICSALRQVALLVVLSRRASLAPTKGSGGALHAPNTRARDQISLIGGSQSRHWGARAAPLVLVLSLVIRTSNFF